MINSEKLKNLSKMLDNTIICEMELKNGDTNIKIKRSACYVV